jgi:hypothetical protein
MTTKPVPLSHATPLGTDPAALLPRRGRLLSSLAGRRAHERSLGDEPGVRTGRCALARPQRSTSRAVLRTAIDIRRVVRLVAATTASVSLDIASAAQTRDLESAIRTMVVEVHAPTSARALPVQEITTATQDVAMPTADVKKRSAPATPSELRSVDHLDPAEPSCPGRDVKRTGAVLSLAGQDMHSVERGAMDRGARYLERRVAAHSSLETRADASPDRESWAHPEQSRYPRRRRSLPLVPPASRRVIAGPGYSPVSGPRSTLVPRWPTGLADATVA